MKIRIRLVVAVLAGFGMFTTITAQDTITAKPVTDTVVASQNKWRFLVEPYLFFGGMKGQLGLDSLPVADVDADAGYILDHLKFAAMVYFEAYSNKWAITSDLMYMKLGQDATPGVIINEGDVSVKQLTWELAGLRRLLSFLEAGIGFRLNSFKSELDLNFNTPGGIKQDSWELTETWVDPIIVARSRFHLLNDLLFVDLRGDIGGFGIGSDFAWQVQGNIGIRISKLLQASLGYRVISVDYENGSGKDYFLNDTELFGPMVRFGFNF